VTVFPRPAITLVTDRRRLSPTARTARGQIAALERQLDEACSAGVDIVQIREPDLDARVLADLVRRVVGRRTGGAWIVVNDRADVALAAGADGVHLGSRGAPVERVRALNAAWIIGRSVHEGEALAPHRTAAYLIFGSVFPTVSKPGAEPAGLDALRVAVAGTAVPVVAIGGITPARAAECYRAGAAGVAAIGVFLPAGRTPDALGVTRAVRDLRAAMTENVEP
jgi:thiamine-phosphate pyrophosphorylase